MNTPELYSIFLNHPKICIDSRLAEQGGLFFALKGDQFDGNLFAKQALEKCSYAVVDNPDIAIDYKYILVDDVLDRLQKLAKYHRKRLGLPIIAVTGSNGKTTTKELIAKVLGMKYKVGFTQGNYNNHIGVPLTLLSFTQDHDFGIVEMGANHIGEIADLCKIASPDFGIITNVGKAHLEGFGSLDGVKKAKGELYRYLYENDGVAFINDDNELLEDMNPPHSVISYGTKGFTHCQGRIETADFYLSLRWQGSEDAINSDAFVEWNDAGKLINTQLYGTYNFENVLAAICVGNNFSVADADIKKAIESYVPQNNRSELLKTAHNTIIVDSYNANPTSVKAALDSFSHIKANKKTVILGDMFELGEAGIREHGVIVALIQELKFNQAILVGPNFHRYNEFSGVLFFETVEQLTDYLKNNHLNDNYILLKGSRGMKMENLIKYL